ncbi:hypothetical protein IJS77_00360 [bacterium]|nr:hypothetical protein [bacterium]
MFLYRPMPPSVLLRKTDPKEYEKQWVQYAKAQSNYQLRLLQMDLDRAALMDMHLMHHNNQMGIPCPGCTLGGGFGIFM